MSDDDGLFREIAEDVRRDQMQEIWRKYGVLILGVVAAVIIGASAYQLNGYWSKQAAEKAADHLYKAESLADEKKKEDALKLYSKLAKSGPAGYAAISKLRIASLQAAKGNKEDAINQFISVANNGRIDPIFSDFAVIQTAMLTLDKELPADVKKKLVVMSAGAGSWRHNAREILALSDYKAKKYKEASATYAMILADIKSPASLKKRAEMMVRMISNTLAEQESAASAKTVPAKTPEKKK